MNARRILWLYCIFAILGLALWLVLIVGSSGKLRSASAAASAQLQETTVAAEAQRDKVAGMEEEQRQQRADLSAEDAIRLSAKVQEQQAILAQLDAARATADSAYSAAAQAYQAHMKRLIPIIALLILHLVGTLLFWPRPGDNERPRPNKSEEQLEASQRS